MLLSTNLQVTETRYMCTTAHVNIQTFNFDHSDLVALKVIRETSRADLRVYGQVYFQRMYRIDELGSTRCMVEWTPIHDIY